MEDITKIIKPIIIVMIFAALLFFIPLFIFIYNFNSYDISNDPSDWAVFGNYIGGVVGTSLSIMAIIISFFGIYLSLKISLRLQEKEIDFNKEIAKNQKDLIEIQNKPFLFLDLSKIEDETEIIFCNYGLGSLIIKKLIISVNNQKEYKDFNDFFNATIKSIDISVIKIFINTSPDFVIPPNGTRVILKITPLKEMDEKYLKELYRIRDFFKDVTLKIEYEDIFGNIYTKNTNIKFLGN